MAKRGPEKLNTEAISPRVEEFQAGLLKRVVGQDRAIRQLARAYQVYLSGLSAPGKPLLNILFLGPTGCGKTRTAEAMAEVLFGSERAILKIDCAEFQHSHEISKLVGSPPGYLGHRETQPLITQEALEAHCTDKLKLSLVLFDEIEKASDALWNLLLGILDKAELTLGDNRRINFVSSIIFMTSNVGSRQISEEISGRIGFVPKDISAVAELDQKIYKVATEAARKKFSPEFMNRIDKIVVFRSLQYEHLEKILDIELNMVQERILSAKNKIKFVLRCSGSARAFLLREGCDKKYGARHLKRAIERHLVAPLSNLVVTHQIKLGDLITADLDNETSRLIFFRETGGALVENEQGKPPSKKGDERKQDAPETKKV